MGIEMGTGIKSSRVGWNGNFLREIPAPYSYQIYSNLPIEFTIIVAQAGYFGTMATSNVLVILFHN